jgi:diaminopimelate epimerase
MGPADLLEGEVRVATEAGEWSATAVHVPNPHAVVFVPDPARVGRLTEPPRVTPADAFPDGVNVEFVRVLAPGHLILRVHERGVGETRSCGTGICAAAVVAARRAARSDGGAAYAADEWRVDVPGGTTHVRLLPGGEVELTGPAVLVGTVDVDLASLAEGRDGRR